MAPTETKASATRARATDARNESIMDEYQITETTDHATGEVGYRLPSGEVVTYGTYLANMAELSDLRGRAQLTDAQLSDLRELLREEEATTRNTQRRAKRDAQAKLDEAIAEGATLSVDSEIFAGYLRHCLYQAWLAGNCTEAENFAERAGAQSLEIWHTGRAQVQFEFHMDADEIEFLAKRVDVQSQTYTGPRCCTDDYCECEDDDKTTELGYLFDARAWVRSTDGREMLALRLEELASNIRDESRYSGLDMSVPAIINAEPSKRNIAEWITARD